MDTSKQHSTLAASVHLFSAHHTERMILAVDASNIQSYFCPQLTEFLSAGQLEPMLHRHILPRLERQPAQNMAMKKIK